MITDLKELSEAVYKNAVEHGFHDEPTETWWPKMLLNSIAEITEVWDADRNDNLHSPCDKAAEMIELGLPPITCLEEEYADRLIRCLDEAKRMGIDIVRAANTKHAYNVTRPRMHGKKH